MAAETAEHKLVRIHRFGGPDVLQFEEIAVPSPKEGEVLVHVSGAGINPVDYKIRAGSFPRITASDLPITLGRDICGTVQKSGAGPAETKTFGLDAAAAAHRYLEKEHPRGKVVFGVH